MMKKQHNVRFAEIYTQKSPGVTRILVDLATGVNYLFHSNSDGHSGGLTPLLDPEGKPVITPPEMFIPQ